MKITCLHGYFIFEELEPGQVSEFMSAFKVELVRKDNYYTFKKLAEAKDYSLLGLPYLGVPATKTYEGQPWEVMKENGLVYHFNSDLVLPIETIFDVADIKEANSYFLSQGLIVPGSFTNAVRIKNYSGFYLFDQFKFKYTEISNE